MRRIVKRSTALNDLVEIALHISIDSANAAEAFFDAVEATVQRLSAVSLGSTVHLSGRAGSVCLCSVSGFRNYLVVYREHDDVVEILRIVHGARDWERLLNDDPP